MVKLSANYEGGLRCEAQHGPSEAHLQTDAPVDNEGRGEAFSPTDLVGTALLTCILTTMGIVAKRRGLSLEGARGRTVKEMSSAGPRRITRLAVELELPSAIGGEDRAVLERAAAHCPVHASLHPDLEAPIAFSWTL